jgi:hypothetical protein
MKKLLLTMFLLVASFAAAQTTTTLNNNGCSCTSYQGAYLPVTNGGPVAFIHMNPYTGLFETLDANFNVIQEWNDLVVVHPPSAAQPYLNATFNGGQNYTHQIFTKRYYRSGYILMFAGGSSALEQQ